MKALLFVQQQNGLLSNEIEYDNDRCIILILLRIAGVISKRCQIAPLIRHFMNSVALFWEFSLLFKYSKNRISAHRFCQKILCTYAVCALIRSQLHTKIALGVYKQCALIRFVHLSGVHLSGFHCIYLAILLE